MIAWTAPACAAVLATTIAVLMIVRFEAPPHWDTSTQGYPYISDTAVTTAGHAIFSVGTAIAGVLLVVVFVGVERGFMRLADRPKTMHDTCRASTVLGIASAVFLFLTATVTLSVSDTAHNVFAFLFFACATLQLVLSLAIVTQERPVREVSAWAKLICVCIVGLLIIAFLAFLGVSWGRPGAAGDYLTPRGRLAHRAFPVIQYIFVATLLVHLVFLYRDMSDKKEAKAYKSVTWTFEPQ